jgi:hypothetical protein
MTRGIGLRRSPALIERRHKFWYDDISDHQKIILALEEVIRLRDTFDEVVPKQPIE